MSLILIEIKCVEVGIIDSPCLTVKHNLSKMPKPKLPTDMLIEDNLTFRKNQDAYFDKADIAKYNWQTKHPYISSAEKELLPKLHGKRVKRFLELGCGEAANIALLDVRPPTIIGVDLYPAKLQFAKSQHEYADFVTSDARSLPFPNCSFDFILLKDLLHHIPDADKVLKEAKRLLVPGGRIVVIEANGNNPLFWLFGTIIPAEKMVKRNTINWLKSLFGVLGNDETLSVETKQPFPLFRILFHYRFGLPWLVRIPGITAIPNFVNRTFEKTLPKSHWSYIILHYKKLDPERQ